MQTAVRPETWKGKCRTRTEPDQWSPPQDGRQCLQAASHLCYHRHWEYRNETKPGPADNGDLKLTELTDSTGCLHSWEENSWLWAQFNSLSSAKCQKERGALSGKVTTWLFEFLFRYWGLNPGPCMDEPSPLPLSDTGGLFILFLSNVTYGVS